MKSWQLEVKLVPSPSMRAYLANWSQRTRLEAHSPERAIALGLRKLRPQMDRHARRAMRSGGLKVTVTYLGEVEMAAMTETEIAKNHKLTGNVITRKCDQCLKPINRNTPYALKDRKEEFCSETCTDQFVEDHNLKQFQRKGSEKTMAKNTAKPTAKAAKTKNKEDDFIPELPADDEDGEENEEEVDYDDGTAADDESEDEEDGDNEDAADEEEEPVKSKKAPKAAAKAAPAKATKPAKAEKAPKAEKPAPNPDEFTPRQALAAIPKPERYKGKFPLAHVLGQFASKFGAKKVEGQKGIVQLPLDKPRKATVADLTAVCPADLNVLNYIKVLGDYGTEGGCWHLTRDEAAGNVTLVPGKKK